MERAKYIDGLRGVAAIMVVIFHYAQLTPNSSAFFAIGSYGVHIFFIISGYVIMYSARTKMNAMTFLKNRFIRVYPTYFVCLSISIFLLCISGNYSGSVLALGSNYLFFHKFLGFGHVDPVYWTLLLEAVFYGYIAFAIVLFKLKTRVVYLSLIAHSSIVLFCNLIPWEIPKIIKSVSLLDFGSYFALGMIYYLKRNKEVTTWQVTILFLLIAIGLAFSGNTGNDYSQFRLSFISYELASVVLVSFSLLLFFNIHIQKALSWRPLLFLGYISYPLYLLHNVGGKSLLKILGLSDSNTILSTIVYFTFSISTSYIVARYIDYGLCKKLKRKFNSYE